VIVGEGDGIGLGDALGVGEADGVTVGLTGRSREDAS
jgi:hypothetical protein